MNLHGECGTQEIASMAFSPDGRLLAAQGGAPEWNLVLWVWEKSKVVTSVKTTNGAGNPVYQVTLLYLYTVNTVIAQYQFTLTTKLQLLSHLSRQQMLLAHLPT